MKKWRQLFAILAIFTVLLSACNSSDDEMPLADIYSAALDVLMGEDDSLNEDMAFIAIDLSNFEDINETSKQEIMDYFSDTYHVDVMDTSFEELRESGYFNEETMSLDGILLRVETVKISKTNVVFNCSKYRSAKGAIGMEVTLKKKGGEWRVTKSKLIWTS